MRRWKIVAVLTLGALYLLACEQEAANDKPITLVDDNPVIGAWYLQAVGEQTPIAIGTTVRFEFKEHGRAAYTHHHDGSDETTQHTLTYNLAGSVISIDSDSEDPGVPRVTGMIELDEEQGTLRIATHSDENWLLTREARPGGAVEAARHFKPNASRADPMLIRVQQLAYACNHFAEQSGKAPASVAELIESGTLRPHELTASGTSDDLPARYQRMTAEQRAAWLSANSPFVFFLRHAGSGQSSSVVVSTLPDNGKSRVVIGMANGAVHQKAAKDVAHVLQFQEGALPERWPESAWSREAVSGLEPLSD